MARPKKNTLVLTVTPMSAFMALSYNDQLTGFAQRAVQNHVSFLEMGKLHYSISNEIAGWNANREGKGKERTIYNELRAQGVKDGSISNASYAARIFREYVALPQPILTEAQFDTLTWSQVQAIAKVTGPKSKAQLTPEDVGLLMQESPDTFEENLVSLYTHGVTKEEMEEMEAQAKEIADRAAAAAAQKAEDDRLAQTKAAADRAAAEAVAAERRRVAAQAPDTSDTSETSAESEASDESPAPAPAAAPSRPTPTRAPAPAPTNVTPMPVNPDAGVEPVLDVLRDVLAECQHFSPEGKQAVFERLAEIQSALADMLNASAQAA